MMMEKKLACDIDNNGNVSEHGIPIIAEYGSSDKRFTELLGLQFGWSFKQISENIFENQYGAKFTICCLQ